MNNRFKWEHGWALIVALLLFHNIYLFFIQSTRFDTDILKLLPIEKSDPTLAQAMNHSTKSAEQRVTFVIGATHWETASAAADAFINTLSPHRDLLEISEVSDNLLSDASFNYIFDRRFNVLTAEQKEALETKPASFWLDESLSRLYASMGNPSFVDWQSDPFGLFNDWINARLNNTPLRPLDGKLHVYDNNLHYAALFITLNRPSFSIETQSLILPILDNAENAAISAAQAKNDGVTIKKSGMIFYSAQAAERAQREISIIGLGSLIGILLLIFSLFRSIRPVALIALSIGVGLLGALSISHLIFGNIHLITLVFGASLIGIAQDYGIYYLYNRGKTDSSIPSSRLRQLLAPSLALALLTTSIGYLSMTFLPLQGLRQMAVFSVAGLCFAWLTVICWFPVLSGAHPIPLNHWKFYRSLLPYASKVRLSKKTAPIFIALLIVIGFGIVRLEVDDNIRSLQSPSDTLLQDQKYIDALIHSPTVTQFYFVRANTVEALLQREEQLKTLLQPLLQKNQINHIEALSNWVPSLASQKDYRRLISEHLLGDHGAIHALSQQIHAKNVWVTQLANDLNNALYLTPDDFLETDFGASLKPLWLKDGNNGFASIVMLRGFNLQTMATLEETGARIEGVQWVDRIATLSQLLGDYRHYLTAGVIIAYITIFFALFTRYRKNTWRIIVAPALATVITLALLGYTQTPLQFFNMVALMLILGIGVDYGIFLQEHAKTSPQSAWVEMGASAMTTLLSFGLLSFSKTPILHTFGITLVFGISLVWLIAPCFNLPSKHLRAA